MSTIAPTSSASNSTAGAIKGNDLRSIDLDQFLKLLLTELQNQDPLNPLDNAQLLQQISQIREIGATNELTETLAQMQLGQNLATASGLIGKEVKALSDSGGDVRGVVDRVSVDVGDSNGGQRSLKIHVGEHSFNINNVREVLGV